MREARFVHGEYRDKVIMGILHREFLAYEAVALHTGAGEGSK